MSTGHVTRPWEEAEAYLLAFVNSETLEEADEFDMPELASAVSVLLGELDHLRSLVDTPPRDHVEDQRVGRLLAEARIESLEVGLGELARQLDQPLNNPAERRVAQKIRELAGLEST